MMNVEPAQSPIRPRGNGRIAAAALVVFGLAAVGAFKIYGRWSPPGGVHRLAVPPFSMLPAGTADPDVGAGFADAIVRALSGSGAITVSPVRGHDTGGADIVLEGSVERRGDGTLRVEARLLRAQDGRRLWSETYSSTPSRLVEVEDAVLDAVIEHLRVRLEPGERDRMRKSLRAGRPGT